MTDPVDDVLKRLRSDARLRESAAGVSSSFLNNVADVFERYGFGTTETYLRDKQQQQQTSRSAAVLLGVLDHLRTCSAIHQDRSIGRLIIKTLPHLFEQGAGTRGEKKR